MAGGQTPPATDDALLASMCTRAQSIIERKTKKKFESRTETRYYDVPSYGRKLYLDDDLLSVTTLTNGDGTVLASTEYHLWPNNGLPAGGIVINYGSTFYWKGDSLGNIEGKIAVAGAWGYTTTANDDVKQTTIRLASWLYRQKDSAGEQDRPLIGPDGTVLMPSRIPADVMDMINDLMSRAFA